MTSRSRVLSLCEIRLARHCDVILAVADTMALVIFTALHGPNRPCLASLFNRLKMMALVLATPLLRATTCCWWSLLRACTLGTVIWEGRRVGVDDCNAGWERSSRADTASVVWCASARGGTDGVVARSKLSGVKRMKRGPLAESREVD